MKTSLDKRLVDSFPNLYADREASMQETAMCWGFACDDGWFDIIWRLSEQLENEILKTRGDNTPRASQVKEKFGGLRFYMTSSTEPMDEMIRRAEDESYKTCEVCGKAGRINKGPRFQTLCAEHQDD